jgi:hypothetical protein
VDRDSGRPGSIIRCIAGQTASFRSGAGLTLEYD